MWCFICACGLLALGAAEPPKERAVTLPGRRVWDVVRSEDGDFAFSMPAQPVRETRNIQDTAKPLEVLSYSCTSEGSVYRLQRFKSPQTVHPTEVIAELDHIKPRYLKDDARLVKETKIVVDGVIGDDLTYTVPSPQGAGVVTRRMRHFVTGHCYYVLTVASPPGKPLPDAGGRFLSSLTFEAIVKAHYARMRAVSKTSARAETKAPSRTTRAEVKAPGTLARPEAKAKAREPKVQVKLADSTPEDALKSFVLALAAQDGETLRTVALPDNELPWLLRGRPAAPSVLARMKAQLDRTPMKRLTPGDTARMADGVSRILQPDDVREGQVVIWPDGAPYATGIKRVDGHWKVVPQPFITARKAAAANASQRRPPSS